MAEPTFMAAKECGDRKPLSAGQRGILNGFRGVLRSIAYVLVVQFASTGYVSAQSAQAVRTNSGFTRIPLARNDDLSSGQVSLGFTVNFFGVNYSSLYVNNNGNVTFNGPLEDFTPQGLTGSRLPIIAPFWADVDTRGAGSGLVTYGTDTVNGRPAFGANYLNVGYYDSLADKLNSFQVVLIERSDTGAGNFDIEFNYNRILWETGEADDGINGLGGASASAGYSNGSGSSGTSFQIPGSLVPGSFLDSNPNGLIRRTQDSGNVFGRLIFSVRGGTITPTGPTLSSMSPTTVPALSNTTQLQVNGTGFVSGAVVRWTVGTQTTNLQTQFQSSVLLQATIPSNLLATPGTALVSVANPTGSPSSSLTFTISAPTGLTLSSMSPTTVPALSNTTQLQANGTGFVSGAVVRWTVGTQTTNLQTQFQSSVLLQATIPSNLLATPGTALVSVVTPTGSLSNSLTFTIGPITAPNVTITGLQGTSVPTQSTNVGITLSAPATTQLDGTLTLTFQPNASSVPTDYRDPATQFAAGGTALNFTIPVGATTPTLLQNGAIQQGTVAGTITVTLTRLVAGNTNLLPTPAPSRTIIVARLAPVITVGSVVITGRSSAGFSVEFNAYATTRELTNVIFTFQPAAGAQLTGTSFTVSLASVAPGWFSSTAGLQSGGSFHLTVPFTFSGDINALGSVSVTIASSQGVSTTVTGNF